MVRRLYYVNVQIWLVINVKKVAEDHIQKLRHNYMYLHKMTSKILLFVVFCLIGSAFCGEYSRNLYILYLVCRNIIYVITDHSITRFHAPVLSLCGQLQWARLWRRFSNKFPLSSFSFTQMAKLLVPPSRQGALIGWKVRRSPGDLRATFNIA